MAFRMAAHCDRIIKGFVPDGRMVGTSNRAFIRPARSLSTGPLARMARLAASSDAAKARF